MIRKMLDDPAQQAADVVAAEFNHVNEIAEHRLVSRAQIVLCCQTTQHSDRGSTATRTRPHEQRLDAGAQSRESSTLRFARIDDDPVGTEIVEAALERREHMLPWTRTEECDQQAARGQPVQARRELRLIRSRMTGAATRKIGELNANQIPQRGGNPRRQLAPHRGENQLAVGVVVVARHPAQESRWDKRRDVDGQLRERTSMQGQQVTGAIEADNAHGEVPVPEHLEYRAVAPKGTEVEAVSAEARNPAWAQRAGREAGRQTQRAGALHGN